MNKLVLFIAGFLFFSGAKAQVVVGQNAHVTNGFVMTKPKVMDKIEGTPYLEEEFRSGAILFEDKEPLKVYVRYNVLDEEMEIKVELEDSEIYKFTAKENIKYRIGDLTYVKDEIKYDGERIAGYFGELFTGDKLRLLVKADANVSEPKVAKSSYESDKPGRISIDEEYYVIFQNGKIEEVRLKRRDLKKVFDSEEAKDYLSDNKIKSVEDLVAFAAFYDKL